MIRIKRIGAYSLFFLFLTGLTSAKQPDLKFYLDLAHQHNPDLQALINNQKINLLQNDLTQAQFKKPQVNFTSDYLFAPYFFNRGQFMSITTNPEQKAYGYDIGLSNGGLYAAQLNVSTQLFTGTIVNTYSNQVSAQNQLLENQIVQIKHEIDKYVSDQYVTIYQLEQQDQYLRKIILLVQDRATIAEELVKKGIMAQSDYLLLKIEINQRELDIQQLKANLSVAFSQLNNTCYISDTSIYQLAEPSIVKSTAKTTFNYEQKFAIDSVNLQLQQQVFNLKYKPQLFAYGSTGLNATDASNLPHDVGLTAALHLNIPIYYGGQKKIIAAQNKLGLDNLQRYKNQTSVQVRNNLLNLEQQIVIAEKSISLLNSQIEDQETVLQLLKEKVVSGQISVTDFLNAVENYAATNQQKMQTATNLSLFINQYNYVNW